MNELPAERRIVNGKTFRESWSRAYYAGIEHHRAAPSRWDKAAWWAVVVILLWACSVVLRHGFGPL